MNKIIRNIFVTLVILVLIMGFNSSYKSLSIDNLAYVIALGIDTGENEKYKITFQFTTGTPNPETGSTEKNPSIVNSVEANSIDSGINIMDAYMAKRLNKGIKNSHLKVIKGAGHFCFIDKPYAFNLLAGEFLF